MPKAENASYNIEVEPFSVRKISRNRPASVDCTLLHMSCENFGKKHCKAILNNKSTKKVKKSINSSLLLFFSSAWLTRAGSIHVVCFTLKSIQPVTKGLLESINSVSKNSLHIFG